MAEKKAKHSTYNTRGLLFIDCSECNRGGNGTEQKCTCGGKIKRSQKQGCFTGTLLAGLIPRNINRKAVAE